MDHTILRLSFLRIFLPLTIFVLAGAYLFGRAELEQGISRLKADEKLNVSLGAAAILQSLDDMARDLKYIASHSALRAAVDATTPEALQHLAEDLVTFSGSRATYDQLRWIDETGMERVRVNYLNGQAEVTPANKLQDKGQRYFFIDASKLKPGEIFVSPLDLNIEQDVIETPYEPVLRAATPVTNSLGAKRGIVILNLFGKVMLDSFASAAPKIVDHAMLLNSEGYWLKSPQATDEWGFMFNRADLSLATREPLDWAEIRSADSGQAVLADGLWTWQKIYPLQAGEKSSTGATEAFARSHGEVNGEQYFWIAAAHVQADALSALRQAIVVKLAVVCSVLLGMIGIGSRGLASAWVKRAEAEEALRRLNAGLEQQVDHRTQQLRSKVAELDAEIDERKLAQETLRLNEESLSITLNSIGDAVIATNTEGQITRMNPAAERLTGWALADSLGQPLSEVFCIVDAATRKSVADPVQRVMADGQVVGLANHTVLLARNGHEYQIADSAAPIRNAEGAILGVVLVFTDVTEKYRAEEALRIAATAFESQQGMLVTNAQRVILRVNRTFTTITGYSAEEAVGQTPSLLSSGRHDKAFHSAMTQALDDAGIWAGEIWNRRKCGEIYPEWLTISAVKDNAGVITHYVAVFNDISERVHAQAQIDTLAFYDPLTQLPNRRLLLDRLDQALHVSTRHARRSALLFVDLDNFKTLNDTLGHLEGDALLVQVAHRLKTCIRDGDTLARLGSDEFVVMLEGLSEDDIEAATQAETVAENILKAFVPGFALNRGAYHGTPSIGVTLFGGGPLESSEQPLKRAELAMFEAKAAGRNTLRFFDAQMQADVSAHAALEADLREALLQDQFLLHYQPQVVGDGRLTGVEALVRWQHPQRGMVLPAKFIPLAEENGLILPLGQWVLETACNQLTAWASVPYLAHLTMAVNVSARQFKHPDFVDGVLATLARTRATPKLLKLELTESMLVEDVDAIIAKMGLLKAHGVTFSLDDFGTGYSSLAYLKRLPLDQLKIDQGFVRNIVTDPNDTVIAKMVVVLAESMGLSVIAEGVELQAQAEFLAHLGCHAYQGYFFSRPLPLEAFEAFVRGR